jgi:hypothetical protein
VAAEPAAQGLPRNVEDEAVLRMVRNSRPTRARGNAAAAQGVRARAKSSWTTSSLDPGAPAVAGRNSAADLAVELGAACAEPVATDGTEPDAATPEQPPGAKGQERLYRPMTRPHPARPAGAGQPAAAGYPSAAPPRSRAAFA